MQTDDPASARPVERPVRPLTDMELQSLRNLGNASEQAADEIVALRAKLEQLRRGARTLYDAVNAMMAPLGYHGTISARDDRVQAVMDAMGVLDDVTPNVELTGACTAPTERADASGRPVER